MAAAEKGLIFGKKRQPKKASTIAQDHARIERPGVERKDGCPCVLPAARGDGHFGGLSGAFERLVERAGLDGVTPHVMWRSFASVAADLGFVESTIAAMLGHAAGSVTARHTHHLDSVLIAAADKVTRAIEGYLTGAEAKIVALPKRGRKGAG